MKSTKHHTRSRRASTPRAEPATDAPPPAAAGTRQASWSFQIAPSRIDALTVEDALDPDDLLHDAPDLHARLSARASQHLVEDEDDEPVWNGSIDNRADRAWMVEIAVRHLFKTLGEVPDATARRTLDRFIDGEIDVDTVAYLLRAQFHH